MKVKDRHFETIWIHPADRSVIQIIDQRWLPFDFVVEDIHTAEEMFTAIQEMHLRGAPLIGAAGALGMYLAVIGQGEPNLTADYIRRMAEYLILARPTAVNLAWAVGRVAGSIQGIKSKEEMVETAYATAIAIVAEERENCLRIGKYGMDLIQDLSLKKRGTTVNILTHCNAGWLACIDYGTALAPVYLAHDKGISLHVWVDETRPRNQGARLTAWELQQHGIPCTVITDNAGGLLMMKGMVDMVIVGCDRASVYGDVVNKVGTYLKALAAFDNRVPFYAALPSSTIDWELEEGALSTKVEERDPLEVRQVEGWLNNKMGRISVVAEGTVVSNPGFDITPARLITAIITERGITRANRTDIQKLFPEKNINPVL